MSTAKKEQLAKFTVNCSPVIMWPVVVYEPQEDGPEKELVLATFRFRRPRANESKDYFERKQKRFTQQMQDFDEAAADSLAMLDDQAIEEARGRFSDNVIALAKDKDRKKLTDEEREVRRKEIFDEDAERAKWWKPGWKVGTMFHHEGRELDPESEDDREYLMQNVRGLKEAIDEAIAQMHAGARQKNSKP